MRDSCPRFVQAARDRGSDEAAEAYERAVEEFLAGCSKIYADELTREDVTKFHFQMKARGLSARTVSNRHFNLRAFLINLGLPEGLLRAPRGDYRNASELAEASQVSVMSAFRLVRQLRQESFLDDERGFLRLVRRDELMRRWQAAYLRSVPEMPLRWIVSAKTKQQLPAALYVYSVHDDVEQHPAPRACLGLFAAAESLGFGFVHGVPPYFYLERLDRGVLSQMTLSPERAEHAPDVYVRIPSATESVFRGAVQREGVPIADIVQVWLDVSSHPGRGAAQAEEIRRRVLAAILEKQP